MTRIFSQLQVSSSHSVVLLYKGFSSLLDLELNTPRSPAPLLNFLLSLFCSHTFSQTSQTKKVSKEQGVSFHRSPLPSRFQSSRQCSCSPFSYWKLFGSPAFQFSYVIGFPVDIQKNLKKNNEFHTYSYIFCTYKTIYTRSFVFPKIKLLNDIVTMWSNIFSWWKSDEAQNEDSLAFLSLVSAACPEMLMAHSWENTKTQFIWHKIKNQFIWHKTKNQLKRSKMFRDKFEMKVIYARNAHQIWIYNWC